MQVESQTACFKREHLAKRLVDDGLRMMDGGCWMMDDG
jgi:hypothetical protein